jgi:uncharacterized iron-regulated membrane protein
LSLSREVSRFWQTPHRVRLRRVIFTVHLWTGVGAGVGLVVVSLSGSLIVFKPELQRALLPRGTYVATAPTTVSLEEVWHRVRERRPADTFVNVTFDGGADKAWSFRTLTPEGERVQVYVDQYRGAVLYEDHFGHNAVQWIYELHANLLAGRTGRVVNGIFALVLVVSSMTGALVWWPGRRAWRKGFKYSPHSSWRRQNYDIHKLVGLATSVLLGVLAVTGGYYCFPGLYTNVVAAVTGQDADLGLPPAHDGEGHRRSLDEVLASAQRTFPEGQPMMLVFPKGSHDPFSVRFRLPEDWHRIGTQFVHVDPYSAEVLRVDLFERMPVGVKVIRLMTPLHYGTIGGLGTRVVWLIVGVAPAILFVTGCLMWWNRSLRKRLVRRSG